MALAIGRAALSVVAVDEAVAGPLPSATEDSAQAARVRTIHGARAAEQATAFRSIYDAHVDFVWRNLKRQGVSPSELDDKTQEVFVVAYRRFDTFEERGHGPRAWLYQILLRVVADARRHKKRHPIDPDGGLAGERRSVEAGQTSAVFAREQIARLDRALATLDESLRNVLVLAEIEEMTAPEIAETLQVPLNTVYSRLRIARTKLEAALANDGERGTR